MMSDLINYLNPRVTVVMPINRDDGYFDAALNSILNQSLRDFELIIIANNCSDELWRRIESITDFRVVAKRIEIGGLAFAPNYALLFARGEYIARMDADDISFPSRLESQLLFLEKNPHIDICGGRAEFIDGMGVINKDSPVFLEFHSDIISALPYRNPLMHSAILLRKKMLIEIGGYRFGFAGEDYDLWIRLMLDGRKFHNLDEYVIYYRRHTAQATSHKKNYSIFCEVSPMLLMYFFKTKDIKFLIGAFSKNPFIKRILNYFVK